MVNIAFFLDNVGERRGKVRDFVGPLCFPTPILKLPHVLSPPPLPSLIY